MHRPPHTSAPRPDDGPANPLSRTATRGIWWTDIHTDDDHQTIPLRGPPAAALHGACRALPAPLPPDADRAACIAALWSTCLAGAWASAGAAARARRQVLRALRGRDLAPAPRGWAWPWELAAPRGRAVLRRVPRSRSCPPRPSPPLAGSPRVVIAVGPGPAPPPGLLPSLHRRLRRGGAAVTLLHNADLDAISDALTEGAAWLLLWAHGAPGRLALGPGGAAVPHAALAARLAGRLSGGAALSACFCGGVDPCLAEPGPPLGLQLLREGLPELLAWSGRPTVGDAARLLRILAPTWPDGGPRARARALAALRARRTSGREGVWDGVLHAISVPTHA